MPGAFYNPGGSGGSGSSFDPANPPTITGTLKLQPASGPAVKTGGSIQAGDGAHHVTETGSARILGVGTVADDDSLPTNYEMMEYGWLSGAYTIRTVAGGTGVKRGLVIDASQWGVDSSGNMEVAGTFTSNGNVLGTAAFHAAGDFDLSGAAASALTSAETFATSAASSAASTALTSAETYAANASNLSSGTVNTARLGSGTASSGTILYGDNTWKTAPSGGGGSSSGSAGATQISDGSGGFTSGTQATFGTSGVSSTSVIYMIPANSNACNYMLIGGANLTPIMKGDFGLTIMEWGYNGSPGGNGTVRLCGSGGSLVTLNNTLDDGAANAAFGGSIGLTGISSTSVSRKQASLSGAWATATDASRLGRFILQVSDWTGTDKEVLRGESDGTQPLFGAFGAPVVAKPVVTGSKASGAAWASLLAAAVALGWVTDSTSA